MCIMEVHSTQRTSTMLQAMAHNASTLERDLDMLTTVLVARGAVILADVHLARSQVHQAYAGLLGLYGSAVGQERQDPDGHVHTHDAVGNERSLVEQAQHDAGLARQFETR